ncbi:hypothetical protein E2320_000474 [Naja naja]|nr:hypothetical protein E2320_000474 [Naja naja]
MWGKEATRRPFHFERSGRQRESRRANHVPGEHQCDFHSACTPLCNLLPCEEPYDPRTSWEGTVAGLQLVFGERKPRREENYGQGRTSDNKELMWWTTPLLMTWKNLLNKPNIVSLFLSTPRHINVKIADDGSTFLFP